MLSTLVDWVEKGTAPGDLEITEQKVEAPSFAVTRAMPLCRWPAWPHYKSGPVTEAAASFSCAP
jgi:feruloyl esterase